MNKSPISTDSVLNRLDEWRHLPSYQLERRADIFFSFYIPEVLQKGFSCPIHETLIPEFPVPKFIDGKAITLSNKVDYLAMSQSGESLFFVELKTDDASRRGNQDKYLEEASENFVECLVGLFSIFKQSKSRDKYVHLFVLLAKLKLFPSLPEIIKTQSHMKNFPKKEEIRNHVMNFNKSGVIIPKIVYIQPTLNPDQLNKDEGEKILTPEMVRQLGCDPNFVEATQNSKKVIKYYITFAKFSTIIDKHDDASSKGFAQFIKKWGKVPAGRPDE